MTGGLIVEREAVNQQQWTIALQRLKSAMEVLDRAQAPAQIAAHVDLAIHQLQDAIDTAAGDAQCTEIDMNAEHH